MNRQLLSLTAQALSLAQLGPPAEHGYGNSAARCPAHSLRPPISRASPSSQSPAEQKQCWGGPGSVPQDCREGKNITLNLGKPINSHDMKRGLQWPAHLSPTLLLMRPTGLKKPLLQASRMDACRL